MFNDQNREVVLYIAQSLDGYIATESGGLDWLDMVAAEGEDYGYNEFVATIDAVIIGRKTYDKVMSFGIEFPHKGRNTYVVSRTLTGKTEDVSFYNGEVSSLISEIRRSPGKNIYVDGGSELVLDMLKNDLIDRFIISIIPVMLGSGIRLFRSGFSQLNLSLVDCVKYPSGLVQLHYGRKR
jgi:dihydrofolate reductase